MGQHERPAAGGTAERGAVDARLLGEPGQHTPSKPLLESALDAVRRNLRVFPITPGAKSPPLIKEFYNYATSDESQIRDWWSRWPNANIGISTDGLIVADIDIKNGKDGRIAFRALRLGRPELDTLIQLCPTGGRHVVYSGPDRAGGTGKLGDGVDVKAHHGYILGAGSYVDPACDPGVVAAGYYTVLVDRPILAVPGAILSRLDKPKERGSNRTPLVKLDQDPVIARAVEYLRGEAPPAIQGNGGDDTAYKVACQIKDFGLSEVCSSELMHEHYEAKCQPYDRDWLETKVRSAYAHGQNRPGSAHPDHLFAHVTVGLPPISDSAPSSAPKPLSPGLPPVRPFDPDLLPDALRPWVMDIADRMQCPPDFIAVTAIVALGSVIGRKVAIRPQRETNWCEVPNLWGCIVGRPGVMKSPAMNVALVPLKKLDARAARQNAAAKAQHASEIERFKIEQSVRATRMKDLLKKDDGADLSSLAAPSTPRAPRQRRYITNDTSYEALGLILQDNPNGVLAFRDELVAMLKPLDRDENAAARGFLLAAWNGNDPYSFDRITRESVFIEACCLSVLGATQPARLGAYIAQAVRGGAGDDGMIQRFSLLVWPDVAPDWRDVDRAPDLEAERAVDQLFELLDCLDLQSVGAERCDGGLPFLRLAPAALAAFQLWREELEGRVRSGDLHPALEAHLSKYRSLAPKLALIFHLTDGGRGPVSRRAIERALAWLPYLESHAARAYASVTAAETTNAKTILGKLKSAALASPFTARDVHQAGWSGLSTTEDVAAALSLLVDFNWLSETTIKTAGRPKITFSLNPAAF